MMMLTVMVMVDGDDNGDLAKAQDQVEGKKNIIKYLILLIRFRNFENLRSSS